MPSHNLIELVRLALKKVGPCRAREVVAHIHRQGESQVDVRAVNQVLYGPLRREVEQNSAYEWSFREQQVTGETCRMSMQETISQSGIEVSPIITASTDGATKASLLRTLQRLRSGLPPTEGLEHLSVGYDRVISAVQHRLNGHEDAGRWLMVRGNYGAGKTHFLQIVRSIAHSKGYATCFLCADSGMSALNHPQRFTAGLLGSLEMPGRASLGYEPLIFDLAATSEGRKVLLEHCRLWSVGSRMPFTQALWRLWTLESIENSKSGADLRHAPWVTGLLADDLCGRTIMHRATSPDVRQLAYHLILMARDLVRLDGHRGLVLLLDEVESIYTKLPSCRSRAGAIRVLAALCESQPFDGILTAIAITPDAHCMLVREMANAGFDDCLPSFEPVNRLLRNFGEDSPHLVDCQSIRGAEIEILLERVRHLYLSAYPDWSQSVSQVAQWIRFAGQTHGSDLPNRLLVHHAVDLLDTQRYGT